MTGRDRIMTRQINSVVGHFIAECNLDKKTTIIRDPRNAYRPVAFVPSVEKAEVIQAIRRVGQKAKLEQSFELLGIQAISDASQVDLSKAERFVKIGTGKPSTKVSRPLRAGGSLPEPKANVDEEEYVPPPAVPARVRKSALASDSDTKASKSKAPAKAEPEKKEKTILRKAVDRKLGSEHGW